MDTCLILHRYGRKPMLLVSHISGMGFGLCSAFSSSFTMFAVLRFFTGFTITGTVIISTVLSEENLSILNCFVFVVVLKQHTVVFLKWRHHFKWWVCVGSFVHSFFIRCGVGEHWAQKACRGDWQPVLDICLHELFTDCILYSRLEMADSFHLIAHHYCHNHLVVSIIKPILSRCLKIYVCISHLVH